MQCIIVRLAAGGLIGVLLAACVPLSEQQLYERNARLLEAKEEFFAREAYCSKMGGSMEMRTRALGKADYLDYRSARCVRR